jgi:hypothetical protein
MGTDNHVVGVPNQGQRELPLGMSVSEAVQLRSELARNLRCDYCQKVVLCRAESRLFASDPTSMLCLTR